MHVERVVFERVFDVGGKGGRFSFSGAHGDNHGVALPGGKVPQSGQALTIIFGKAGDWSTVEAYYDDHTGKVISGRRSWWLASLQLEALAWIVAFAVAGGVQFGSAGALAMATGGIALFVVARTIRNNRRMRRQLEHGSGA